MKKTTNKEFWEDQKVIDTQDQTETILADFELFLFEQAKIKSLHKIETVKIIGCGTGREINEVVKFFNPETILALDISENMIKKCNENLALWGLSDKVTTLVSNAKDVQLQENTYDLITFLNSVMTYVPEKRERELIFKNAHKELKPNGVVIGTVHNQIGTFKKTAYFKVRSLLKIFLKHKVGQRMTGFKGFKFLGYYFSKSELLSELKQAGFKNVQVLSLEEFYKSKGVFYNRKTGYNNLIFIAES
ncbi:class I SAM-dependent methyltransferase [Flavobacterium sp. SM15]|uniref:class I SAM-dependent methyltransferase n=1 Tax=Flavobacterium sp. SM15 TaxID=2908005 RepID=UPI001EDBA0DF|nr:class I SAM-dependent methyltransferase [Flavobacterium sp. SM15]MCG2611249.1 class I SAM-dependent methyltransferase [Flavobacterium sp. SM15]